MLRCKLDIRHFKKDWGGMNADGAAGAKLREIIDGLHSLCGKALVASFDPKFGTPNGSSYGFSSDMERWTKCLKGRKETEL